MVHHFVIAVSFSLYLNIVEKWVSFVIYVHKTFEFREGRSYPHIDFTSKWGELQFFLNMRFYSIPAPSPKYRCFLVATVIHTVERAVTLHRNARSCDKFLGHWMTK
jgi:hypothetical protein